MRSSSQGEFSISLFDQIRIISGCKSMEESKHYTTSYNSDSKANIFGLEVHRWVARWCLIFNVSCSESVSIQCRWYAETQSTSIGKESTSSTTSKWTVLSISSPRCSTQINAWAEKDSYWMTRRAHFIIHRDNPRVRDWVLVRNNRNICVPHTNRHTNSDWPRFLSWSCRHSTWCYLGRIRAVCCSHWWCQKQMSDQC